MLGIMENQPLQFVRHAIRVARQVVPNRLSKYARPAYRPASLFAALLLKEHMRLNNRGLEDVLRLSGTLRRLFGFRCVPDHSTFWWFARRWITPEQVAAALAATVRCVPPVQGRRQVALDSTGLWPGHTSRYFEWRAKRERSQRGWLKWALAMWVGPQVLLAQRVRPGPAGDFPDLPPLTIDAAGVMHFDEVVADAGYDSGYRSLSAPPPRRAFLEVMTSLGPGTSRFRATQCLPGCLRLQVHLLRLPG